MIDLTFEELAKANRWYCHDCIYHEHLFDGVVYRGVRCHYPMQGSGKE